MYRKSSKALQRNRSYVMSGGWAHHVLTDTPTHLGSKAYPTACGARVEFTAPAQLYFFAFEFCDHA